MSRSACGPMLPFKVRNAMCASPCKQGRAWAAAGRFGEAVGEYTDCTAVLGLVAPLQNSLHSLRSLWSNTCNESVHEAREYARGPRALRSSSPHRRAQRLPKPGLAGTSVTCDGRGAPPFRQGCGPASAGVSMRRRGGEQGHRRSGGPSVPCERPGLLARRGLQGQLWGRRAYPRASWTDSQHLFDHSERSERRKLCGATPE